jgi:hypothetical protein
LNGVLNLFYPVLDAFDRALSFLPAGLRLATFGVLSGALAMGLYRLCSNQARIRAQKAEIQKIRAALQAARDDFAETMRLSRRNLAASFGLVGVVLVPAVVSSLPLLAVIGWLAAHYGHVLPSPGAPIPLAFTPADVEIGVEPQARLLREGTALRLLWPAPGEVPSFTDARGTVYAGPPADLPATVVHKRAWWNWLLGNEAGYLRADAALDAITFALPARAILPGLPGWLAGWEAIYFLSVLAASVVIKIAFRIH